jgi:hypothetical protein
MSYSRIPSTLAFSLLTLLLPFSATAFQDPCRQVHRNLDREIDYIKQLQKQDMQACLQASGVDSDECLNLKDQQAQELLGLRNRRTRILAACPRYFAFRVISAPASVTNDYFNDYCNRGCVKYPSHCKKPDYYVKHPPYQPGYPPKIVPPTRGGGAGEVKTAQKPVSGGAGASAFKENKQEVPRTGGSRQDSQQSTRHAADRDASSARGDVAQNTRVSHNHDSGGNSGSSHSAGTPSHSSSAPSGSTSSGSTSSGSANSGSSHSGSSGSSNSGSSSSPAQSSNSGSSATAASASPPSSGASHPK